MKELVEVIAKSLVDNPEEVTVTETEKDRGKPFWNCMLHRPTWEK